VSAVAPPFGPAAGGGTVSVTGTNFAAGDTVAFGGSAATGVTVNSATLITATSPAGTGTVDVTVTGPGGTSATSPADQFTYTTTTGAPPTYTEASGFPAYSAGIGLPTLSIQPQAVGDLVVLFIEMHSGAAPTVSGLAASNIAWQTSATVVNTDSTVPLHVEVWFGVATSASAGTTTISYSGSMSGNNVEVTIDSFHATGSGTWRVAQGGSQDGSSSTVSFPSLTSAGPAGGGSGGVYAGYSWVASSYASGSTPGFSYFETPRLNVELRNTSLAESTIYSPTATQYASVEYTSTAAIFYLAPSG
jgi:hypothetical protein